MAAFLRMLAGVFHQVAERFGHPLRVAADRCLPFQFQFPVGPEGLQLLPGILNQLPDITLLEGELISVRAEFFQPQQAADQRFHPFHLPDLLFKMLAVVHLAEQPQGSQRCLQLVGNIRRQVAGTPGLLPVAFFHGLQPVLHLHGGILHLGDRIRLQGHGQFSPISRQVVFHPFREGLQAILFPEAVNQYPGCSQQEDSDEDVSDH